MSTHQEMAAPRTRPQDDPRARMLAGTPVDERRLRLAGMDTALLEGGGGTPMVLLHGPGGNATQWLRVIPGLVETHRVIAPDLPGQGESEAAMPLDAERVLDWLDHLIEQTCATPPILVGFALGGAIAARFAATHPGRIARLVLVDSLGLRPFQPDPAFGTALQTFLAEPTETTHDALWSQCAHDLDALRAGMGAGWEPFRDYNLDRIRTPGVIAALGSLLETFGGPAIPKEDLRRIDAPVTLIWGRHDRATPLDAARSASQAFGWRLHVIDDCGDDPPVEQPHAFLQALL